MSESLVESYETVHMVDEYYDGPRTGIADFHGVRHAFRSLAWETSTWDADEDRFELTPVPPAAGPVVIAHGDFQVRQPPPDPPPGVLRPLIVRWTHEAKEQC